MFSHTGVGEFDRNHFLEKGIFDIVSMAWRLHGKLCL